MIAAPRGIFIDTSAFYAAVDQDDQWHPVARSAFDQLASEHRVLFTSDFVVAETHALLLRRVGRDAALRWLQSLSGINLLFPSEQQHPRTISTVAQAPVWLSYTDANSVVLMRDASIRQILTFDSDFSALGFERYASS